MIGTISEKKWFSFSRINNCMNFKSFYLTETPHLNDDAGSLANTQTYWDNVVYTQLKNYKKIKMVSGYDLMEHTRDNYRFCYVLYDADEVIAVCYFSFIFNIKERPYSYPKLGWTAVKDKHRNKKIFHSFINTLMNEYGGVLSDDIMTTVSSKVFSKFYIDNFGYLLDEGSRKYRKFSKKEFYEYLENKNKQKAYELFVISKKELK